MKQETIEKVDGFLAAVFYIIIFAFMWGLFIR